MRKTLLYMHVNTTYLWPQRDVGSKASLFAIYHISKLCGAGDVLEGRDATHSDLERLDKWDHANSTKFKEAKGMVEAIPSTNTGWLENGWRAALEKKDLRMLVDKKLGMTWQRVLFSPEIQLCPELHQKQWGWKQMTFMVPFKPNLSMIPWICELCALAVK